MFKEYSNLILPDEEKAILKAEFDQLETIDQKYKFWEERFDYDYSFKDRLDQYSISDFLIIPKDTTETKELNKRAFTDCHLADNIENSPAKSKADFIESMKASKNKETRVEYELHSIDDFIFRSKYPMQISKGLFGRNQIRSYDPIFFEGYEEYLLEKKDFDWGEKLMHVNSIATKLLGIEWAKYRDFVKNYLKPEKKQNDLKLNGEQKFLVLHYLEVGKEIEKNTKRSKLFEFFIDELSYNSIRPMFSDITQFETEDNLNTVIDLFRLLNLNSLAREIEEKLPKKNKPK